MVTPIGIPITTEGLQRSWDAAVSYLPSPGFSTPLGEDEARDRFQDLRETYEDNVDLSLADHTATLFFSPPESELEAAAILGGEAAPVVLKPAARLGSRFLDDAGRLVGKVRKIGSRGADDVAGWAGRHPVAATGAGALGIESLSDGAVSDRLGAALDRSGDAAANIAGEAGENLASGIAGTVGTAIRSTLDGLLDDKLGTVILLGGLAVAAAILTPLGSVVADAVGGEG